MTNYFLTVSFFLSFSFFFLSFLKVIIISLDQGWIFCFVFIVCFCLLCFSFFCFVLFLFHFSFYCFFTWKFILVVSPVLPWSPGLQGTELFDFRDLISLLIIMFRSALFWIWFVFTRRAFWDHSSKIETFLSDLPLQNQNLDLWPIVQQLRFDNFTTIPLRYIFS